MRRLLIICGPTATGKTEIGIHLAKKFDGEIVSADSRQVYKGMDIITGKDIPKNSEFRIQNSELGIKKNNLAVGYRLKDGIPIWLVDIVSPDYPFNVGEYSLLARKVIEDIWARNKLPILVGGSGLYIKSVIEPLDNLSIPPNNKLRKSLDGLTVDLLQQKLKEVDHHKWDRMNNSDKENPRRLIRAIEIAVWKKRNPYIVQPDSLTIDSLLMIGLGAPNKILLERIEKRIEKRIEEGVLEEVKKLMEKRYTYFLYSLSATGFEDLSSYLAGKESLNQAIKSWKFKEREFARRQMTWFKKDKRIAWFDITEPNYTYKIEDVVGKWYT